MMKILKHKSKNMGVKRVQSARSRAASTFLQHLGHRNVCHTHLSTNVPKKGRSHPNTHTNSDEQADIEGHGNKHEAVIKRKDHRNEQPADQVVLHFERAARKEPS